VVEDTAYGETRFVLIGLSLLERVLFTVHAEIGEDTIRIISARRAASQERRRYEEGV